MSEPRIAPGTPRDVGRRNAVILKALGLSTGGRPANVFRTLARHQRLFRGWLRFAGTMMPGGTLPRADTELVILRVAHNCDSAYELDQHRRIARFAGLSAEEVDRVGEGPDAPGWSARRRLLLRVADTLHAQRDLPDDLWSELPAELDEVGCIELLMLIGHYEGLAMTLNALRVVPDAPAASSRPPRVLRIAQKLLTRD
jgi:alkylhydroperoxidase family enzyme